jgi:pSer/pThr/pTyr-binding forkhead associated (FHA) protein
METIWTSFASGFAVMLALSSVVAGMWILRDAMRLGDIVAKLPLPPQQAAANASTGGVGAVSPGTLAILVFNEGGRRVEIRNTVTMIGRNNTDDVRLNDVRVSRRHARLEQAANGAFEIHNETASRSEPNALLVNGVYREHAVVGDGDTISLGGISFVFHPVPTTGKTGINGTETTH